MINHIVINDKELYKKIRKKEIRFGGNKKLKIYGTLYCLSGRRMKKENREFFNSENEAIKNGYRPCGHCMRDKYEKWKNDNREGLTKIKNHGFVWQ